MTTVNRICLITPGHLSSNPRLVKEAITLTNAGYAVHIIFTQYMDHLIWQDQNILDENPTITYDNLIWTKDHIIKRAISKVLQKLAFPLSLLIKRRLSLTSLLVNRNSRWQLRKAIHATADLYIAHNLGALPIVVAAANKLGSYSGFDAEDFHRQELTDSVTSKEYRTTKLVEDLFIPQLSYFTAAAPMIANAYAKLYPNKNLEVLNNVFSEKLFCPPKEPYDDQILRLFWFSQTIGQGRGIEDIIKAIGQVRNPLINLSLLGNIDDSNRSYFTEIANDSGLFDGQVIFITSVSPTEVFMVANQHDIGLALERQSPLNRDICLTNKIFTYLGAGLATIVTETSAQIEFINQHPQIGTSYRIGDIDRLAMILDHYYRNRKALMTAKKAAYQLAKTTLNWELESRKLLQTIKEIHSPGPENNIDS